MVLGGGAQPVVQLHPDALTSFRVGSSGGLSIARAIAEPTVAETVIDRTVMLAFGIFRLASTDGSRAITRPSSRSASV
jgi:hypothetical protein